jgi:hypothetical protein
MDIEVTDEMRQEVHLEDCIRVGHQINFGTLTLIEYGEGTATQNMNAGEFNLPHIKCMRCDSTWIIFPTKGIGYENAERIVYETLREDHDLARQIVSDRAQRADKKNKNP